VAAIGLIALAHPGLAPAPLEPAFGMEGTALAGIIAIAATVPWALIGFEAVTQVSGECAFPRRLFTRIMVLSIVIGTLMYLTLNTAAAAYLPAGYENWAAYLRDLPNLDLASIPSFEAGRVMAGSMGLVLFGLSAFCAVLSGVVGFYAAATRLVYVMAVDGALSKRLATLDKRYGTPIAASITVFVLTLLVPLLGRTVLTWIVDLMSLGALIAYLYVSLATLRRAQREGSVFMRLMGVAGVFVSGLCLALLVVPIAQLGTSLSPESYVILVAWIALGINFFTPTYGRS